MLFQELSLPMCVNLLFQMRRLAYGPPQVNCLPETVHHEFNLQGVCENSLYQQYAGRILR